MNLYIKGEINTPKDILKNWKDNPYLQYTYIDKECTIIEQNCGKRRSFEDIYKVFKTYFPEITEEEVLKEMIDAEMSFYFCSNINKIVFHFLPYKDLIGIRSLGDVLDKTFVIRKTWGINSYTAEDLIRIYENMDNIRHTQSA
jgi:hypothetical protein